MQIICCTQIKHLEELDHLKQCVNLHALNIEHNPVTHIPNYRLHLIFRFPKLKLLDNKVRKKLYFLFEFKLKTFCL
jgi:hypothetical protein